MLAYVGPPVTAWTLVVDPPASLLQQCTAAREQTSGCDNPDGWGIGWYPAPGEPERYRTSTPMPADDAGLARLAELVSGHFVAHIRLKSPGSPVEVAGNAHFVDGPWMFAHNGHVEGFREGRREELRAQLTPARRAALAGDADSEVLFGLLCDTLDRGVDAVDAVGQLVCSLGEGNYNLFLSDGSRLIACRWGNTLYLRRDDPLDGATLVVSEPHDERPGWEPVPDRSLVVVEQGEVAVVPVEGAAGPEVARRDPMEAHQ
ncbi:MAG TPA: class II glutamine amidotransferase [Acidimicrobiales bacterium]|nr:class II glutamine amidotransferase [Acidimicrobiales bacterium]